MTATLNFFRACDSGSVATFVVVYNALFVLGYDDFNNIRHAPIVPGTYPLIWLPLAAFTLSSPALSLLLGESYAPSVVDDRGQPSTIVDKFDP